MKSDFLAIDELSLDTECRDQAQRFFEYSMKLADARQNLDEAKANLDITVAELNKAIRSNPGKYGLDGEKLTESAINSRVPLQPQHKQAQDMVFEAKHRVDVLSGAVGALDQRKRMLVLMVELRRQDLTADPKVSGDGKRAVEQDAKRRTRTLGQRRDDNDEDGD